MEIFGYNLEINSPCATPIASHPELKCMNEYRLLWKDAWSHLRHSHSVGFTAALEWKAIIVM